MSSALLRQPKSGKLVERAVLMLGGALDDGRDVKVLVPWGDERHPRTQSDGKGRGKTGKQKGNGKEGKWIYAVPMVRGRAAEGAEVERSWMCFVAGRDVGDLWNTTTSV